MTSTKLTLTVAMILMQACESAPVATSVTESAEPPTGPTVAERAPAERPEDAFDGTITNWQELQAALVQGGKYVVENDIYVPSTFETIADSSAEINFDDRSLVNDYTVKITKPFVQNFSGKISHVNLMHWYASSPLFGKITNGTVEAIQIAGFFESPMIANDLDAATISGLTFEVESSFWRGTKSVEGMITSRNCLNSKIKNVDTLNWGLKNRTGANMESGILTFISRGCEFSNVAIRGQILSGSVTPYAVAYQAFDGTRIASCTRPAGMGTNYYSEVGTQGSCAQ